MAIVPLLLLLQGFSPAQISPDSVKSLRDLAYRAERTYESLLRSMAPVRYGRPPSAEFCDEIIGRFCLTFDRDRNNARRPDTTVAGKIISARQLAVETLRRAFSELPGDLATAGPLIRYLIEDGRADEAVSAARTFAWATDDPVWGPFLIGFSLHAARQDSVAERFFQEGLMKLDAKERDRIQDLNYLLAPDEQPLYRKLSGSARDEYHRAHWILADPLYLTPGNESYVEHLARHTWSRILAQAPIARGMLRWDRDLEQLTVRYGVPTSRERVLSDLFMHPESMTEYYDPESLAYLPETLYSSGVPPTPPPGTEWELERSMARSGYRPLTISRLRPFSHQLSRFPAPDGSSTLRVDAETELDDVARESRRARTGLFILDSAYNHLQEKLGSTLLTGDTIRMSYETRLGAGRYVYSLELFEDSSQFGARARYGVEIDHAPGSGLILSDPVITLPFGSRPLPLSHLDDGVRPQANLVFRTGETIGLFAEGHRLDPDRDRASHFMVSLTLGTAEPPSLLARAWGWVGRKIGVARPAETPRLAWEIVAEPGQPIILAVDLPLDDLKTGLYALDLQLIDSETGEVANSTRMIRIEER